MNPGLPFREVGTVLFENLSDKLQAIFQRLRGSGRLREEDVNEVLREVRIALLEADVHLKVVKELVAQIRERALGQEVMQSLTPAQHVIKIVNEQLISLLGGASTAIHFAPQPPTIIMLCGLQGSGKTTTAAKLASMLIHRGRSPLLVACDIYRPAAAHQLKVLGDQIGAPVVALPPETGSVEIAKAGLKAAHEKGRDIVILDTAGRLHIDEAMMAELERLKAATQPHEILLVVDAMTGQDAIQFTSAFHQRLAVDGLVITKLDGDARGGAALSIRAVTGIPVKLIGVGEKTDALEVFHPDRMASRILGMGDVVSLIEKVEATVDAEKAAALEKKLRQNDLDLNDFLEQLQQIRKMGPLDQVLGMIPGIGNRLKGADLENVQFDRQAAIIYSMTPEERRNPAILNGSRKRRISGGCGVSVQEINQFLKQFEQMRQMVHQLAGGGKTKAMRQFVPRLGR